MIVDPRYMSFDAWVATLVTDLPSVPYVQYTGGRWQDWASLYIQTPALDAYNLPNPNTYSDWRKWAFEFIRNLT